MSNNKTSRLIIGLSLLFCLGLSGCIGETEAPSKPAGSKKILPKRDIKKILRSRKAFSLFFQNSNELLAEIEKNENVSIIHNPGTADVGIVVDKMFMGWDRIDSLINIQDQDSDQEKILKIYDFVKRHTQNRIPLYESKILHEPPYYFSVYGLGFCDDAAANLVALAQRYGFQARTRWLGVHVIAEVYYDEAWRVYDPHTLGIIKKEGKVAAIDVWKEKAEENKLSMFNEAFLVPERHTFKMKENFLDQSLGNPYLNFLRGEKKIFFDKAFMLSNSGQHLSEVLKDKTLFFKENEGIANFVREIPLESLRVYQDIVEIKDYFPIVGVFLQIPKDTTLLKNEIPRIDLDYDFKDQLIWLTPEIRTPSDSKYTYYDYSIGVKNLDIFPSHGVRFQNITRVIHKYPKAKMYTVHFYSRDHLHWSKEVLDLLSDSGLEVVYV